MQYILTLIIRGLQFSQAMAQRKYFPFYKHLVAMECRKDIILENDFTNTKTRDRNISFLSKYKNKFVKNQMRIIYLVGFSFVFSLGFVYDTFFDSHLFQSLKNQKEKLLITFDNYQKHIAKVNYKDKEAVQLGNYFINLQQMNTRKQITSSSLSSRIPAFMEIADQSLDVNTFVDFCLSHSISVGELPAPNTLL